MDRYTILNIEYDKKIAEIAELKYDHNFYKELALDEIAELKKQLSIMNILQSKSIPRIQAEGRKEHFIEFACYLLDNHESYFPSGEDEIQLICHKAVEFFKLKEGK